MRVVDKRRIAVYAGQSHLIFGTGSTGCVTISQFSKLCCVNAHYKPLEILDAIALTDFLSLVISRYWSPFLGRLCMPHRACRSGHGPFRFTLRELQVVSFSFFQHWPQTPHSITCQSSHSGSRSAW